MTRASINRFVGATWQGGQDVRYGYVTVSWWLAVRCDNGWERGENGGHDFDDDGEVSMGSILKFRIGS